MIERARYFVRYWYLWLPLSAVSHYVYWFHRPANGRTVGILFSCMYILSVVYLFSLLFCLINRAGQRAFCFASELQGTARSIAKMAGWIDP